MRIKPKFTFLAAALVALSMLGWAAEAQATTINATYSGSANFGSGGVGYDDGSIAPNPNSSTSRVEVGIGGDSFTSSNHSYNFSSTGQFNTWCVDIYHWMSGGTVTYNVEGGSSLASMLSTLRPGESVSGATRVSDMITLADEQYSLVNNETESAAFQLALWAIAYGTPDASGHFSVGTTDPGFNADGGVVGSAYGALANTWLADLGTLPNTGNYSLTFLSDGDSGVTQDVVVFTDPPAVPEPASVALFLLGLASLVFVGRGKKLRFSRNTLAA